jgi:hypothetical protein
LSKNSLPSCKWNISEAVQSFLSFHSLCSLPRGNYNTWGIFSKHLWQNLQKKGRTLTQNKFYCDCEQTKKNPQVNKILPLGEGGGGYPRYLAELLQGMETCQYPGYIHVEYTPGRAGHKTVISLLVTVTLVFAHLYIYCQSNMLQSVSTVTSNESWDSLESQSYRLLLSLLLLRWLLRRQIE